jgi:short-subunit dehydrogenase
MPKEYVVITGAYGGLGKALSVAYAKQGYGLVLVGRKEAILKEQEKNLSQYTDVHIEVCDISDWRSCQVLYKNIQKAEINCKAIINNAAITHIQKFDKDYDIEKYQQLIKTNLNAYVYMSKLFIEDLIQNRGSIINISSVIGYAPVIGRTSYAASKFGLEGFFSVLQAEMRDKLHIMMVYPTFIATKIRESIDVNIQHHEILTTDRVAEKILKAHILKKKKVFIGKTARLSYYVYKFFPKLYVNLMRKKVDI